MVLELQKPRPIWQIMFSTHHTDICLLYMISSLAFLFMGGVLALIIRVEMFSPGPQFIADSMTYNRIFTVIKNLHTLKLVHGVLMKKCGYLVLKFLESLQFLVQLIS